MMIQSCGFGKFVIDNKTYDYDIKIIGNKIIPWNSRRGHDLRLEDLRDLLRENPKTIIVGTGQSGILTSTLELKNFLKAKKIELIERPTKDACELINAEFYRNKRVTAILHSTC